MLFLIALATSLSVAEYHVSNEGHDEADGLTPATAWSSLKCVNEATFQPGDRLLFLFGDQWTGFLRPKGSGLQDRPIRLGRYGQGVLPLVVVGEQAGVAVRFENQDFWE